MRIVSITNTTRQTTLAERCQVAETPWSRIRGLLGRASLGDGEGLLLAPCNSIHMFGMKFAIDVVFVTRDLVVTDLVAGIAPGRMHLAHNHSGKPWAAVELPVGTIVATGTQRGDQLQQSP